jgi:hypothetical protein
MLPPKEMGTVLRMTPLKVKSYDQGLLLFQSLLLSFLSSLLSFLGEGCLPHLQKS